MARRNLFGWLFWAAIAVIAVGLIGCGGTTQETAEVPAETETAPVEEAMEAAAVEVEPTEEIVAALSGADAADGTVDNVVAKCPGCALTMDGSAENSLAVAGYDLHFCSGECKEMFEKDTTASVLALAIPVE